MSEIVRELTPNEEYFFHTSNYGAYFPIQLVDLKGYLPLKPFKEAIELVLEKYKVLQTVIIENEEKYYFKYETLYKERFFKENFQFYEKHKDDDWNSILKQELKEGIKTITAMGKEKQEKTGLLLRILLISSEKFENSQMIIGYHHSLFDGSSLCMVINDILDFTSKLIKREKIEFKPIGISNIKNQEFGKSSNKENMCDLPIKIKEVKDRENYFHFDKIKKEEMVKLLRKAKDHQVTFNSLVNTAMIYTSVKHLFQQKGKRFNLWNAVSNRIYLNVDKKEVGLYSNIVSFNIDIEEPLFEFKSEKFWEYAKIYHQMVLKNIDNGNGLTSLDPRKMKNIPIDSFSVFPFNRTPSIGGSNRGVLDNYIREDYDLFKIVGFYLSTNYENIGSLFVTSCSTINGNCYISFMGCVPLIEKEIYDSMVKYFFEILHKILEK